MQKTLRLEIKEWQTKWKTTGWKPRQEDMKIHSQGHHSQQPPSSAAVVFTFAVLSSFTVFIWRRSTAHYRRLEV